MKNTQKYDGFLKYQEHSFLRSLFIFLNLLLYFVGGAAYYSFPMWLNDIIPQYVHISRSESVLFAGLTYVSLGIVGAFLIGYNSLHLPSKLEFMLISSIGLLLVVLSWLILLCIVLLPNGNPVASPVAIGCSLSLLGLGIGIFFMVWFGKMFLLSQERYSWLVNFLGNVGFSLGAVFSLSLKFLFNDRGWMIFMFTTVVVTYTGVVAFTFFFYDEVIIEPEMSQDENSGFQYLKQFILWGRPNDVPERLAKRDCDVTSRQFHLLNLTYTSMQILAILFMANLGPITNPDSDDAGDDGDNKAAERSQLIIIIWSNVGQTIGRIILPGLTAVIIHYLNYQPPNGNKLIEGVMHSKTRNRTTLPFIVLIGFIFFFNCLVLKFTNGSIDFVYASTLISVGYGMNWLCTSLIVNFFPPQYFTFFLAFFQMFSSAATLICICIVSFLEFSNETIFATLLALSIVTIVVSSLTLLDRFNSEVKNYLIIGNDDQETGVFSPMIEQEQQ